MGNLGCNLVQENEPKCNLKRINNVSYPQFLYVYHVCILSFRIFLQRRVQLQTEI